MARGGNFIVNILFISLQYVLYQDNSIAVTIDTFECISIFRKKSTTEINKL